MVNTMTNSGRFTLLLLTAGAGVACNSNSDLLNRRDGGGGVSAAAGGSGGGGGAAGSGGGGDAGAGGGTPGTGGAAGAAAAGGGGAGGMPGPIIGMPLATFDTTLDGFFLVTDMFGLNNNATERNVGGYGTGLQRAELSHDPTAGSPTPGCLKLSVPFSILL